MGKNKVLISNLNCLILCTIFQTWASKGWLFRLESLDFAGGTPVHIGSGFAGLAMAIVLGKRAGFPKEAAEWKPHNVNSVFLGTAMLWFGWFGFNGGSALSGSARAAMAAAGNEELAVFYHLRSYENFTLL